jgi:hypothetical protein
LTRPSRSRADIPFDDLLVDRLSSHREHLVRDRTDLDDIDPRIRNQPRQLERPLLANALHDVIPTQKVFGTVTRPIGDLDAPATTRTSQLPARCPHAWKLTNSPDSTSCFCNPPCPPITASRSSADNASNTTGFI